MGMSGFVAWMEREESVPGSAVSKEFPWLLQGPWAQAGLSICPACSKPWVQILASDFYFNPELQFILQSENDISTYHKSPYVH